jgi:hypothetical protein
MAFRIVFVDDPNRRQGERRIYRKNPAPAEVIDDQAAQ